MVFNMNPTVANSASDVESIQVHSVESQSSTSLSFTSTVASTDSGSNPSEEHGPATTNKYVTPTTSLSTKPLLVPKVTAIDPDIIKQKESTSSVSNNNYLNPPTNVPNKRIIRKITPIDPKKLQQAGLDRKIAEALSKQKSQQAASSRASNRLTNVLTTPTSTGSSPAATNVSSASFTKPTNVQTTSAPAKTLFTTKTIIPPKITITAPETTTEMENPDMAGLNSQQRLVRVKHLLNKKLLQKKQTVNCDNVRSYQHLKPHSSLTGSPISSSTPTSSPSNNSSSPSLSRSLQFRNQIKLPTKELKTAKETPPRPQQLYCNLKETEITTPPIKPIKIKTPKKSPQDIARKLDFQTEGDSKVAPKLPTRPYSKCLNKELNEIPKAVIKTANTASTPLTKQHIQHYSVNANVSTDLQTECLKQPKTKDYEIPKAAIKAGNEQQNSNNLESNMTQNFRLFEHNNEQKQDFQAAANVSQDFQQQNKDNNNKIPKAVIKAGNTQPHANSLESYSPQNFRFFQHTEQNLALTEQQYTAANVSADTYHMPTVSITAGPSQQLTNMQQSFRPIQDCEQNMSPDLNQIPKALIKSVYGQKQTNTATNFRYSQHSEQKQNFSDAMPLKVYPTMNVSQDFQTEYLKQQKISYPKTSNAVYHEIPKAAIKSGHSQQQQYTITGYSYKPNIDFPDVSPLKVPFPTVNVPKETPLPTIDSFKKPYPLVNAVYYDLQAQAHGQHKVSNPTDFMHTNYETLYTNPATSLVNNNPTLETFSEEVVAAAASPTANCLIVLENKVLSQDEMIDLTELRLSTTNTPRFVNPHKPIPEVVIKQEKADEYSASTTLSPPSMEQIHPVEETKKTVNQNNETTCEKVVISNKQNKKIIINAQKLKLPPEQLADLAKKIKERTAANKVTPNQENKSNDIRILNTKANSRKIISPLTAKHTAYVLPHNNKELPVVASPKAKYILHNKPAYMDPNKQDHNYQLNETQTDFKAHPKHFIANTNNTFKDLNKALSKNREANAEKSAEDVIIRVKEEPKTLDISDRSHTYTFMDTQMSDYRKSAVEIIDEPEETEDCFSAVDFITALNNTNPITEETSLELSPEELNLNASCAMNLSPLRIQSYPPRLITTSTSAFKPYTPKHDNSLNPEQMSTIVIESSKGPETIITNESPNKYGTLQKVKMFSNLGMCDMDLETPIENVDKSGHNKQKFVLEPLKEPKNIDLTNVIVASDPDEIKLIISQVNTGNEAKISKEVTKCPTANKNNSPRKGLVNNSLRSSEAPANNNKEFDTVNTAKNSSTTLETVKSLEQPKENPVTCKSLSENIIEESQIKDPKSSELPNPTNTPEPSSTKDLIKTPEKAGNLKSILKAATPSEEQKRDNTKNQTTNESVTTKSLEADMPTNVTSIDKSSKKSESAKATETSSATTVTSKRISRFKKGKINLVQRNKSGVPGANKSITGEKKNENNKQTLNETTNTENASKKMIKQPCREENDNIPREALKTGASPTDKSGKLQKAEFQETNQDGNKIVNQIEEQIKYLETNKVDNSNESTEEPDNNDIEARPAEANTRKKVIDDNLDKTIDNSLAITKENTPVMSSKMCNDLKSPEKRLTMSLIVDNNEIPKACIKTCYSPQRPSKSPEKDTLHQQSEQTIDLPVVMPQKHQEFNTKMSSDLNHIDKTPEKLPQPSKISEFSTPPSKLQTPQKSPQDIARKLDFEIEMEIRDEQEHTTNGTYLKPEASNRPQQSPTKTSPKTSQELQQTEVKNDSHKTTPVEAIISNNMDLTVTQEHSYFSAIPVDEDLSPQNLSKINLIQDNINNISYGNITPQLESTKVTKTDNLDPVSKAILKSMRNAKVSLIDIIKHSPPKSSETSPVIPFKKKTPETNEKTVEFKDITTLLEQLKSNKKDEKDKEQHKEKNNQNTTKDVEEPQSAAEQETKQRLPNLTDENQIPKITANTRSSRASLGAAATLQETPALKPATTRKRHSTRPLISDDDLEFLPVNAEVKFKLSKSKQNEKELSLHNTPTSGNDHTNRRTRLYSKPSDMELSKHSSPLTKRTRYYSQTLETNVTIRFDALKSATSTNVPSPSNLKHLKHLDTEDSCHDSTQDSNKLIPTKQRKKLRKTLEDIKKSQKSHTDSDSDDENGDYDDCCLKDYEEGNEFLGFEENAESTFKANQHINKHKDDNDKLGKTKGGTLKNWLTTGKAIAPTLEQDQLMQRIRHDDEIPATSPLKRSGSGGMKPFKKRWDLSNSRNEETDITDDTSPADDEEESTAEQIPTTNKSKRGIKNVIDSNKELLDSKKIKLDESLEKSIEHSFIKPRHLRTISKNSGTDSESYDEKPLKGQKPRLRIRNLQENFPTSTKSKEEEVAQKSKESVNENLTTDSDYHKGKPKSKKKYESSGTDSDLHEAKGTSHLNTNVKATNEDIEKHSENSAKGNDRAESRQETTKQKAENFEIVNDVDKCLEKTKQSGNDTASGLEGRVSKRLKSKSQNKDLDKSLKTYNTDSDCPDKTESKQQVNKLEVVKAVTSRNADNDSDTHDVKKSNRFKSKNRSKDSDTSLKNHNTDTDCSDRTESMQQVNELEVDKSVTSKSSGNNSDTHEVKASKRLKSKHKEKEDVDKSLDKSLKSHNTETDGDKSKRSTRLKSKNLTDDDIAKMLDIPEKLHKSENSKNKEKSANSTENNKKKSTKEQNLKTKNTKLDTTAHNSPKTSEHSYMVTECKAEKLSPDTKTSENKTIKKKRGKPIVKSKQSPKTPTLEKHLNDSAISNLVTPLKRSLSTDSSDDEGPLPANKRRSSKIQPKRKLKIEDSHSDSTSTASKKTNKNESIIDSLKPIATPRLAMLKNETPSPTVGRKRKYNSTESTFNSRLLLITKREQLETDEVVTETKPGNGSIQCGFCMGRTSKWISHLAEHYGVGWQIGQEKLNVENRYVVLNCIVNFMKSTGSKGLTCRMCKKEYRSGLGLLMHIEICGAQVARIICEYCKRDYAPSTLPIHMRSCYAKTALENQSAEHKVEENLQKKEEVFGNTGRLKRNSTIKAENKLKVLGAELDKVPDNADIDPKSRIRYVPPIKEDPKWSEDIKKLGNASCPKKRCKFSSKDLKELSEHVKNCKFIKSGYLCNFCKQRTFATEKEAIEHVIKNHKSGRARKKSEDSDCNLNTDDEQSSDDNDLSEGVDEDELDDINSEEDEYLDDVYDNGRKGSKNQNKKPYSRNVNQATNQAIRKEVFDGCCSDLNKEVLKKWKCFLKLNYSSEPLYAEFTAQYSVTNQQDFSKYLPNQTNSMKFNLKTKTGLTKTIGHPEDNIEWSELKRYESIHHKMNTYFFLGAPVKQCCWLPLPAHVNEQYLAVVYRQEMFKFIKFSQPSQHHCIILIIKVIQNNQNPQLAIHYGFLVPDGPVHHVSFLPSGGYDENSNRLGLVAVATVTSSIKVYSLPLNVEATKTTEPQSNNNNDNDINLIEVKPSFLLNLDILNQYETQHMLFRTQCLQICWSEFSGHQHIFASFSNGFMGIWDINNDPQENLNRFVVEGLVYYTPLNYFYVGEKRVKCFALHYDTSGPRWLAASSAYRKFVIYDIKNFMQPLIMKEEVNKNILLSMDWCPLWETLLYSYCDTIPNNGRCVMSVNPTNIMFTQNKLDFMVCGVTQVHYTPVENMCVSALNNGDIVFLDTKELHYECPLSNKFGERRMLYAMDVKQLNGKPLATLPKGNDKTVNTNLPTEWSMQDTDYKEKYGLIFEPLLKLKEQDKGPYLSEQRCPPSNIIPLMRINTLRCNLNLNAKNLIALGYENGFLRLVYFNKDNL